MKSQPVEFLEFIEQDLRYAKAFYDSWQTEGGDKFHAKFRETIVVAVLDLRQDPRVIRSLLKLRIRTR